MEGPPKIPQPQDLRSEDTCFIDLLLLVDNLTHFNFIDLLQSAVKHIVETKAEHQQLRIAIVSYHDLQYIDFTFDSLNLRSYIREYSAEPGEYLSAVVKSLSLSYQK